MAERRPLVLDDNRQTVELPDGDTLPVTRHFDGGDAASTYTTANATFDGGGASG